MDSDLDDICTFLTEHVGQVDTLLGSRDENGDPDGTVMVRFSTATAEQAKRARESKLSTALTPVADFDIDGQPVIVVPVAEVLGSGDS
jgi:hypothetical protein